MTFLKEFDGVHNFRDLGGLPVTGGGVTRHGVVYRSAAPGGATEAGMDALSSSNVTLMVDLRTGEEREMLPDRAPERIEILDLPIAAGNMSVKSLSGPVDAATLPPVPSLEQLYVTMLEQGSVALSQAVSAIARAGKEGGGALVHCTAGKDRTGITCALILDVVGVERSAIVSNYAESQERLAGPWAEGMKAALTQAGIPLLPSLVALMTTTPPEAIESALTWIDTNHGGSHQYLLAGGTTAEDLQDLRAALV